MQAFIFDLNGTMVDDMAFHIKAWYHLLNDELGAGLTEAEVTKQMYGKNSEVMGRIFGKDRFSEEEADRISLEKEKRYQEAYLPHLKLLPGLADFLKIARQKNVPMAIGSAAIPFNINFVLDNLHLHPYFSAIVSASDVSKSKPDPETFLKAAALLQVSPANCIVFEDAPKGVEAALRAGMQAVAITTLHHAEAFSSYSNLRCCVKDYTDPKIYSLMNSIP